MPAPYVVGSSVFRPGDRLPDTWQTDYRDHYHAHPLSPKKTAAERTKEIVGTNRSNLPFFDTRVLTTDSRDHYKNYGDAYKPENLTKPAKTNSQHTDIQFGTDALPLTTDARDHFKTFPDAPPPKTREQRQEEIQATRTGNAVIKSLGYDKVDYVSVMEQGNRTMRGSPPPKDVKDTGKGSSFLFGEKQMTAAEYSKKVSVQFGTDGVTKQSDYGAHFVDYRATAKSSAENPYLPENLAKTVDPSLMGGLPGEKGQKGQPSTMLVKTSTGALREIPRVRSAIDFGRDDYEVRSQYMDSTGAERVWLTQVGGWHTHTEVYVPPIRVKYASNVNHPAVLAAKAAKEGGGAAAAAGGMSQQRKAAGGL